MSSAIFCTACGAPLPGAGVACAACGRRPAAAQLRTPPEDWTRPWGAPAAPHAGARGPRSPRMAAALGIVPGLGHLYTGHRVKGVAVFSAYVGALVLGTDLDLTVVGAAVGLPLDAGGFGIWLFSIWDAYWTARRDGGAQELPATR